jgi:hypothetical protein
MTGRVHILRAGSRYRLVFVPRGPGRHLLEGEDALRTFLLIDLEIPSGVTETAIAELDRSGRHTIDNIPVTDRARKFWPLDITPTPRVPEATEQNQQRTASPASRQKRAKPTATRKKERKRKKRRQ